MGDKSKIERFEAGAISISDVAMTRKERIEKMLHELRYEVEVGMLQGDIEESIGFEFFVPTSKAIPNGVVYCSFRTRPVPRQYAMGHMGMDEPRLKLVE